MERDNCCSKGYCPPPKARVEIGFPGSPYEREKIQMSVCVLVCVSVYMSVSVYVSVWLGDRDGKSTCWEDKRN